MTYQEAQLIRRTAIANMQPRKPTPEDEKLVPIAIRMLTYIAVLHSVVYDMIDEFSDAGLYKHRTKQKVNRIRDMVGSIHDAAYQMLKRVSLRAGYQYNDRMEATYAKIQASILLPAPERSYNLFCALCSLIERDNRAIGGRYDFQPAKQLYSLPSLLDDVGIKNYGVQNIVSRVVGQL